MPLILGETYNICVFAYNEEKNIESSLNAVQSNIDARLYRCYLMANGCTDKTVKLALEYKIKNNFEQLEVIEIGLGDKCNAWNKYIHEVSESVGCHFMIDSDVNFTGDCFPKLFELIKSAPDSTNVTAGMPQSGRNLAYYQSLVRERSCFFGNLYGISPRFYSLIKEHRFFLPVGLNWIDSFLTKAANTDLRFEKQNLGERVIYSETVGFKFDSLSPFSFSDLVLYKNRIARYELGKIQEVYLDNMQVDDWPKDMSGINMDIYENFEQKAIGINILKQYLVKKRLEKLLEIKS